MRVDRCPRYTYIARVEDRLICNHYLVSLVFSIGRRRDVRDVHGHPGQSEVASRLPLVHPHRCLEGRAQVGRLFRWMANMLDKN